MSNISDWTDYIGNDLKDHLEKFMEDMISIQTEREIISSCSSLIKEENITINDDNVNQIIDNILNKPDNIFYQRYHYIKKEEESGTWILTITKNLSFFIQFYSSKDLTEKISKVFVKESISEENKEKLNTILDIHYI